MNKSHSFVSNLIAADEDSITIRLATGETVMKYKVALHESEEGFSVWVPCLPGCVSQGETEQEALSNIAEAIGEYLSVIDEQLQGAEIREIEVAA